jgi:hypothetical protein
VASRPEDFDLVRAVGLHGFAFGVAALPRNTLPIVDLFTPLGEGAINCCDQTGNKVPSQIVVATSSPFMAGGYCHLTTNVVTFSPLCQGSTWEYRG